MSKIIEKEWKDGDFNCKVLFMPMGHRCGYVGVPKGHHMYGLDYEKCMDVIDCHGGLTYSGFLGEENKEYWYLELGESFKTQELCEEQCHSIVEQIKQL